MSAKRLTAFIFAFLFVWGACFNAVPFARAEGGSDITLQIAKSVDKTDVAPGEVFTYTLDYSISGTGEADNAKIVDELPAGLVYISSVKTVHVDTVDVSTQDGRAVVTFNFIAACATGVSGKLRISAKFADGTTADGATAVNNGTFSADGLTDVVSNDVTVTAHLNAPTWSVAKAQTIPSGNAVGGYPVQYRVRVNGNGSGSLNLADVRIVDTLPAEATFVSATNGGVFDSDTNTVLWTVDSIAVGGGADRYVTVTYPDGHTDDVINTATVTTKFYGDDTDQPDKTASCTTHFGAADPRMGSIVKTNRQIQEEYHVGQTSKYGISGAANTGNVPLDDFTIEDAMPDEIDLTSVTAGGFNMSQPLSVYYTTSTEAPYDWVLWDDTTTASNETLRVSGLALPDGTHITRVRWSMGTVPAGFAQTSMISVQGVIRNDAIGTVINTATLDSTFKGSPMPQSSSTVSFDLVGAYPWLAPSKALQGSSQRDFGEDVTWTLTVKNHDFATGQLVDPVAIDVLPPELTYESYTTNAAAGVVGDPTVSPQTIGGKDCTVVRWQLTGTFNPGDSVVINITTKIKDKTLVGWYTNNFYITTNDPGTTAMKGATVTDTDDLDADGQTDDMLARATAQVFVKFQGALTTETWVKGELDFDWIQYSPGNYGRTLPGGLADYRFTVLNDGSNGPISNIVAIDMLPKNGDKLIIGGAARGTQWTPYLVNSITGKDGAALPGELKIYYTTNPSPSCIELYDPVAGANPTDGWSLTPPADITAVTALKFVFGGYTLNPGDTLAFEWPMRAPQGAPQGQIAWDSMGIGATCDGSSGPEAFLPTESSKVGFIIDDEIPYFGVGDHVWVDTNGNGIQDAGEPGVNDVLVNLYDADHPSDLLGFTRTGDDQSGHAGYWAFPDLVANGVKQYIIEYVFPDSYRQTLYNADNATGDADTNTDSDVDTVTVGGGVVKGRILFTSPDYTGVPQGEAKPDKMNYDLGVFVPASLSGVVWNDLDHDGVRESGEPKLDHVTVTLTDTDGNAVTDADGNAVAAVPTDSNGAYGFTDLKPGSYKIAVTNPDAANFAYTAQNAGSDDAVDSDADAAGIISPVTLLSGDDLKNLDAGLHKGIIQGKVWHDLDADGIQDAGEQGISGVTVVLHGGSGDASLSTASDGSYRFDDLDAGSYTVEAQPSATYYVTYQDQGSDDTKDSDFGESTKTTDAIPLPIGGLVSNEDCGLFKAATVGNFVWNDKDWDGTQDAGEPGIPGVTVALTDQSGNPVTDVLGNAIASTTTDSSGIYGFSNVRPGAYRLTVTNPDTADYVFTQANAGNDSTDSDVNAVTGMANFTVASGVTDNTLDAGLHKGMLQGKVWHDLDADGIQDAGENGISSTTVVLHLGSSTWTASTDTNGNYSFIDLNAGSYTVEVQPSAGYFITYEDMGSDDTKDSDFGSALGYTDLITLSVGQSIAHVDCGLFKPATIGDFVWNDKDWDGTQDAGEPGISGVTVSLTDTSGNPVNNVYGVQILPAGTNAGGIYGFSNIRPGTYKLTVTNPEAADYVFTPADQGSDSTDSDVNITTGALTFSINSNVTNLTLDAGLHKGWLQGKVWHDVNANGLQDAGEMGISSTTVVLHLGASTWTATTDSNGAWSFIDLNAGSYTVEAQPSAGYYVTYKDTGSDDTKDSDFNPGTKTTDAFSLAAGQKITNKDCGLFKPATIGDFIWNDKDRDGVQDAGEPGLDGAVVKLLTSGGADVYDVNGNLVASFTTTGGTGAYSFANIRPGSYKLHFTAVPEFMLSAKLQGGNAAKDSDADPATGDTAAFTVQSNTSYPNNDAGMYKASLGDFVWEDTDADGVQDAGEPGIPGVTVKLYLDNGDAIPGPGDTVVATTLTDANGRYYFAELDHGSYYVSVTIPSGYYATLQGAAASNLDSDIGADGCTHVFNLAVGQTDSTIDAGLFRAAAIGDKIWQDMDADGVQDAGEPGISGATVHITDSVGGAVTDVSGNPLDAFTADANGHYLITGLRPGSYKLQFDLPDGGYVYTLTSGPAATGSDAAAPDGWTPVYTLASNQENDNVDGGFYIPASLSGRVWKEKTNNGLQDAGEAGIEGRTVTLYNGSGVPVDTAETDEDGNYSFTGLVPGTYHIAVDEPDEKLFMTLQNAGSDDAKDSDVDASGVGPAVTLVSGEALAHMDAGVEICTDIAVTKTCDQALYELNDTVVFTITAQNLGPDDATGVTLQDNLPSGIQYVSDDASGSYNHTTGIWSVGSLASGDAKTLTITAKARATGSFENTASLHGLDQIDGFAGNNSDSADFVVGNAADVAVTKTVDNGTPWLNDNVIFTIRVDNNGPDTATNVMLNDALPASLEYVSDDASSNYDPDAGVWSVGTVASGAHATIHITAKATALGTAVNSATAYADEFDPDNTNNTSSCSVTPKARADLKITKTANAGTYASGDAITFTLTVENLGPDDATQVTVTDVLPSGAAYAVDDGAGAYDPDTGVWSIGNLAYGDSVTLNIGATAGDSGSIVNQANVTGHEFDPDLSNNSDSAEIQPEDCAVGDLVWLDSDGNGIQDDGEPGIQGITVNLLDGSGNIVATTTTDQNGIYHFSSLDASGYHSKAVLPGGRILSGDDTPDATGYHVVAVLPDGYAMSPARAGDDPAVDSDGSASGETPIIHLKAGFEDDSVDFGMFVYNSIVCRAWFDKNKDGVYDPDEQPLAGVTVNLYKDGDPFGQTITDATGDYSFLGLPDGAYTMKFVPPLGMDFTQNGEVDISDGMTGEIDLSGGASRTVQSGFVNAKSPATGTADYTMLLFGSLLLLAGLTLSILSRVRRRKKN